MAVTIQMKHQLLESMLAVSIRVCQQLLDVQMHTRGQQQVVFFIVYDYKC